MALQPFGNYYGPLIIPWVGSPDGTLSATNRTMDAAGESVFMVGRVILSTGPGTSKTLDSSGYLHVKLGSVTLSDAGTVVRVGVQDASGLANDDTWTGEPYGEWTSASAPTGSAINRIAVSSGTRSISHGDFICVGLEMTARGGADSIVIPTQASTGAAPHIAVDSGSGPSAQSSIGGFIAIEFSDGTIGWFAQDSFPWIVEQATLFNVDSDPDEYALVLTPPFKITATALFARLANVSSTEDFELIIYSDPLGTPVAERTIVFDVSDHNFGGVLWERPLSSLFTFEANTTYAIAYRPTTTGSAQFSRINLGTNGANLRRATHLGVNWSQYSRTNQTGAFTSQDTTLLPMFGVRIGQLDDGASAGGGGTRAYGG